MRLPGRGRQPLVDKAKGSLCWSPLSKKVMKVNGPNQPTLEWTWLSCCPADTAVGFGGHRALIKTQFGCILVGSGNRPGRRMPMSVFQSFREYPYNPTGNDKAREKHLRSLLDERALAIFGVQREDKRKIQDRS